MANIKSAKKRIARTQRETAVNRNRLTRVRTYVKRVEAAIASGDAKAAQDAFNQAQPEVMRGAQKGVMHRNTASRKLSRLAQRIKSLSA
jgi:small subunit ribosomal protein S20